MKPSVIGQIDASDTKPYKTTMALILLLCVILPLMTAAMECPNGVEVNMTCYNLSHVLDLKGEFRQQVTVNQLGILRKNRILYYSFEPKIEAPEYYRVGFINLDDPSRFGELSPPQNFQMNFGCFDIDQANNIMYLGGSNGVYKFSTLNNSLSHFSSRGQTILSLFFKDNVYFVRDGEHTIIFQKADAFEPLLKDDKNRTREEFLPKFSVKKFVITNDNTVVFLSTQGLFAAKAEVNSKVYRLSKESFFRGLAMDLDGAVYAWWLDGIYKVVLDTINPAKSTVVKVANIPSIGALTFDYDNSILFTAEKSLFRLVKI